MPLDCTLLAGSEFGWFFIAPGCAVCTALMLRRFSILFQSSAFPTELSPAFADAMDSLAWCGGY